MFGKLAKKELLVTIERRFQFILLLALFLPFVWDDFLKINPGLAEQLASKSVHFVGVVIVYVIFSYFIFESFREFLKEFFLNLVAEVALVLSYTLVVVIGFGTAWNSQLTGWKLFIADTCVLGSMFLSVSILFIILINLAVNFFKWLKKKS